MESQQAQQPPPQTKQKTLVSGGRYCVVCHVTETTVWRRRSGNRRGDTLCNRCGLFWIRNGYDRPVHRSETVHHSEKALLESTLMQLALSSMVASLATLDHQRAAPSSPSSMPSPSPFVMPSLSFVQPGGAQASIPPLLFPPTNQALSPAEGDEDSGSEEDDDDEEAEDGDDDEEEGDDDDAADENRNTEALFEPPSKRTRHDNTGINLP